MGIQDCCYAPVKKRGAGNTLRMGQACIPCRWVVTSGNFKKFEGTNEILLRLGREKVWVATYLELRLGDVGIDSAHRDATLGNLVRHVRTGIRSPRARTADLSPAEVPLPAPLDPL